MTEKGNDSLSVLVKERGYLKANLTRFKTYVQSLNVGSNKTEAKYRLKKFELIWDEFKNLQNKIEQLDDGDRQFAERDAFETQFFELCANVDDFINNPVTLAPSISEKTIAVKLPEIAISNFDGNCISWIPFVQSFDSLIHNNRDLTNIQRFHYLRSSLKGEALELIKSLTITDENYLTALKVLKNRFDNKRLILKTHAKNLCHLPNITKNSASSLRNLLSTVTVNLDALKNLGQPVEQWDLLLIEHMTCKFDFCTMRDWEATKIEGDSPTYAELHNFLENKCKILESLTHEQSTQNSVPQGANKNFNNRILKQASHVVLNNANCKYCKRDHYTSTCEELLKLPVQARFDEIKKLRLCVNCLRGNHPTWRCQTKYRCKICHNHHHTILHVDEQTADQVGESSTLEANNVPTRGISNHCKINATSQILLSTAIVCVRDKDGSFQKLRCLLDQGSQSNFITEAASNKLSIKQRPVNISISGISGVNTIIHKNVNITVKSQYNAFMANIACLVLPEITSHLPLVSFDREDLKIPSNLRLADPNFNISGPIDLLIGAEIFWLLLCVGQINKDLNGCHLHKTQFGWIAGGKIMTGKQTKAVCNLTANDLDVQLKKFWEINEPPSYTNYEINESACEKLFKKSVNRDSSGRYTVKLPFVENAQLLGNSRQQAICRFQSLEKKLNKNSSLKESYVQFMTEYEELGHMEMCESPNDLESASSFYLPHHAVIKQASATTKLRVVFDASTKSSTGVALNDILLVGPTIQHDLFSILIRFRTHKYALTADIAKMYRQILIAKEDRNYQLILWRKNSGEPLKTFKLKTVTYGTASASFLAIRTLFQLAYDEELNYPLAARAILTDFYVDDLLTGCNDIGKAREMKLQLIAALEKGGFDLRKWRSNEAELRSNLESNESHAVSLDKQANNTKVLGLSWDYHLDAFKYDYEHCSPKSGAVTKRIILSTVAKLFDPLGIIGPVLMTAKILLQKLWLLNIPWDTSVPVEIYTSFQELLKQFPALNEFRIKRQIIENYDENGYELHGFCDASQSGYGACIYMRSNTTSRAYSCHLICAKGRVAPTKALSIPRLELCGALLLANLLKRVSENFNVSNVKQYCWTDSTIVLAWLTSRLPLKTFVANRVAEIQTKTDVNNWHHVSSNENPADIISRGCMPIDLINADLWWHGPTFLKQAEGWASPVRCTYDGPIPEVKKVVTTLTVTQSLNILNKFSSLYKLQRVVAYCLRFIKHCRKDYQNDTGTVNLSCVELRAATTTIILYVQRDQFPNELASLRGGGQVRRKSSLASLNPFIDESGLIRVGGRLKHSSLTFACKHPILLPAKHHVTNLVIKHEHERLLHAGQQTTLASIRRVYWPIAAKATVRKIIHECMKCFKANPKTITQLMGNLPSARVNPSRPFYTAGVDFAGPILLKRPRGRNTSVTKGYIVVFVCFSTRALHLELASDLTAQCFLSSLKRFISRRGNVAHLYSDNATNFTGANHELKEINKAFRSHVNDKELLSEAEKLNITWHHIPPRAPHFGGIWESGVKSVKHHLRRVIGDASLTYEEMYTLLTRIEAILNSRPLYPLSEDPNDFNPLTPAHFLIGEPLTAPSEPELADIKINRLSRWQRIEVLRQHFWKRWSREYLVNLQQRVKWKRGTAFQMEIGMLVLLHEDNQPPLRWPMGRILQLHPGSDGVTRVVSVKTKGGVVRRAVAKICVLPRQDCEIVD